MKTTKGTKKTLSILIFSMLIVLTSWAQNGPKMTYQSVLRDSQNKLVSNTPVQVSLKVQNANCTQTYYTEPQITKTTNQNGLLTLTFGAANQDWDKVKWEDATLLFEVAWAGGSIKDTVAVTAVPYAYYAANCGALSAYLDSAATVRLIHDSIAAIGTMSPTQNHSHANIAVLSATTAPYTDADSTKLDGIAAGAEVNVQSDWKQADGTADDYIKNKPSIRDTVNGILDTKGYLTSASDVIISLQSDLSAAIGKEKTDSTTLAGRIDALEGAAMDCNKVKDCIKDTLSNYTTTEELNSLLQQLEERLLAKIDSLAHIVDSLSNITPVTPDTPTTTFTCGTSKVKDVDLNEYNTVKIGNQCWMAQNLRTNVGTGDNGYPTGVSGTADTVTYGRLYSWTAMMNGAISSNNVPSGVQGICPAGWHVPSEAEWDTLTRYVYNSENPNYKCSADCEFSGWVQSTNCIAKALASKTGWNSNETACKVGNAQGDNNATGFSAVPAGIHFSGDCKLFSDYAYFWSATQSEGNNANALYRGLGKGSSFVYSGQYSKDYGYSVRCLRDAGVGGGTTPVPAEVSCEQVMECMGDTLGKLNAKIDSLANVIKSGNTPLVGEDGQACQVAPTVSDNQGNTYPTVKIGNQCWMAQNLRTNVGTGDYGYPTGVSGTADTVTYGRLYSWAAVMSGAAASSDVPSGIRGICPEGWHVPSDGEWGNLINYVKSKPNKYKCGDDANNIANALSSETGWTNGSDLGCNAGDDSEKRNQTGFSAVPAGYFDTSSTNKGTHAYFWSTTDSGSAVYYRYLDNTSSSMNSGFEFSEDMGLSVRCLRN